MNEPRPAASPDGDLDAERAAFIAEARRLHERYTVEIVERYNVCPWVRGLRGSDGAGPAIDRHVLLQRDEALEPTLDVLAAMEADAREEPVAVAIALYPRLACSPRQFDAFAARVRDADQKRHGGKPVFVSATFHPEYPLDARFPSRLVPFLRRSPDPSLQLVRLSVIEAARGGNSGKWVFDFSESAWQELRRRAAAPPVAERIALDNLATVEREGSPAFEALFRELAEDRARSYARFADLP